MWTIPAARSKNKREHEVPLSAMAIEIIGEQMADVEALAERKGRAVPPFVFPGPGARAAVTGAAVAKAIKREEIAKRGATTIMGVAPWTPHDLRRQRSDRHGGIGISPFVIGHVLNHVSATKATITSRVYARYNYAARSARRSTCGPSHLAGIIDGKR